MQTPVTITIPCTVPATSFYEIVLQAELGDVNSKSASPLFDPSAIILNDSDADIDLQTTYRLDLGLSSSSVYGGQHDIVTQSETVSTLTIKAIQLDSAHLDSESKVKHLVKLTNNEATDKTVYLVITGYIWEPFSTNPKNFPQSF